MNIKKFRQYASFKGNVTFLFILILITTSTIALLAMSQIRNLQRYGNTSFEYLKTYYLSKAGMELALMEVNSRGYGFNFKTSTGDQFIKDNFPFVGFATGEETPDKYFQYRIIGRSPFFGEDIEAENCQENSRFLNPGETLVIPLFYDDAGSKNSHCENLSGGIMYQDNHKLFEYLRGLDSTVINLDHLYTLFSYNSGTMQSVLMNTGFFQTWEKTKIDKLFESPTSDSKYYFTMKNTSASDSLPFCIWEDRSEETGITLPFVTIHVLAKYKDTELEDHLIYSKGYPEYLLGLSSRPS